MPQDNRRLQVMSAGILSLILMMGISRFAYTPLLPLMEQQAGLSTADSGWLATFNYIGYLGGALISASISDLWVKDRIYRAGLIIAVVTTAAMGLTENFVLWSVLRIIAGFSSAAGMLIGSGLILNWLIRHNHRGELGIHFAGVGLGMALCALMAELMYRYCSWSEQWLLYSLVGALIAVPAWRWLPVPERTANAGQVSQLEDNPPPPRFIPLMMASYFCAGVGYVVSATFIVAIAESVPQLRGQGNLVFLTAALAASPACLLWDLIARRSGVLNALLLAYGVHIVAVLLPLWQVGLVTSLAGAALWGVAMLGIVSLVLTMCGRFYPGKPAKMMGKMTLSYGVAQILAPALTGLMAERSGNYNDGIYMAAMAMVVGALLLLAARAASRRDTAAGGASDRQPL